MMNNFTTQNSKKWICIRIIIVHPNAYLPEFLVKLPTPFEVHCTTYKLSNEQTSASKMRRVIDNMN